MILAWYDPTNHHVSTDKHDPLFTPLGQLWPLVAKQEWVGLTMDDINQFETWFDDEEERKGWVDPALIAKYFEAKLKEKNGG